MTITIGWWLVPAIINIQALAVAFAISMLSSCFWYLAAALAGSGLFWLGWAVLV